MFSYRRVSRSLALIGAGLVVALWSGNAWAVVDCGLGGSINAAITSDNVLVEFTGTCNEFVTVNRDRVTIRGVSGDSSLDVIKFGVSVPGVTRAQFQNLTINGGGVFIVDGAFAILNSVTVENTNNGVAVIRNAGAIIINSTLGPSLIDDGAVSCGPLCALDGSQIRLQGTTITGNTDAPDIGSALSAVRNSSIVLRGGNTITNGGSTRAIIITEGSSLRQDNATGLGTDTITGGSDGVAVLVGALSVADFRQATVTGDINVVEHSMVRLGSTVFAGDPSVLDVNGDINLALDSGLIVLDPLVTVNGDVNCADRESSLSGTFQGGGEINCTGFDPSAAKGGGDGEDDD